MQGGLTWIDWAILGAYIGGSTWLGAKLAGRQQTIRDFFLGGRRLPWIAVCGSIIATEISGVTFVGVPATAFKAGGNFTYLQLAIGAVLARVIIGFWFTPVFYRKEIYSPYQFMGQKLGPATDRVTTGLFFLGGFLAQGARIFLAALVLDAITDVGIVTAVVMISAISIAWTWIGGVNTVVWTDVIQFIVLVLGAGIALVAVLLKVPGGISEVVEVGAAAGKFKVFDLSTDPTIAFTLWAGVIGATFLGLGSHGTDQMLAQRLFCCRDERAARKAVLWSGVGQILALVMLFVGVALFAFYQTHALAAPDQAKVDQRVSYILPIFILRELPIGLRGVIFAAIFAAAASSGTSVLSAMGQSALMTFYRPFLKKEPGEKHQLFMSRVFILIAGVVLCGAAIVCARIEQYGDILNLALAMATYTYGPTLGIFLMALFRTGRDSRGLLWAVPYSLSLTVALTWQHVEGMRYAVLGAVAILILVEAWVLRRELPRLLLVLAAAALVLFVTFAKPVTGGDGMPTYFKLAWPWLFPLGTLVTLGLGVALGRKKLEAAEAPPVS